MRSWVQVLVPEADHKENKCAAKIILKQRLKGKEAMIHDEVNVLRALDHSHIVKLISRAEQVLHGNSAGFWGDLSRRISDGGRFTEKDASRTIRQVLNAVDYIHAQNVVHRGERHVSPAPGKLTVADQKPENLAYLTKEANSALLLVDFGIATTLDGPDAVSRLTSGSLGYGAPEGMLQQRRLALLRISCYVAIILSHQRAFAIS
ncbi:Calmodulin-dependent protein kinase cmk2 [Exophiala xenobiotica]|nr:Calmodulin-dependent protein kinase cmk2 [Exophiala xenobiotica]